jgi:divalent metal cation (Fe/Co/Zn/Cd) transporter
MIFLYDNIILVVSAMDLYYGFIDNKIHYIHGNDLFFGLLGLCTFAKFLLYLFCKHINKDINSDSLTALTEDHLNDVLSNSIAIATAVIAETRHNYWYIDPLGAIVISLVIVYRWIDVISEQVRKIVGYTAPPEFIAMINELAASHDSRIVVDVTRAYYFGSAFNVEIEIVLPGTMSVSESHDIALALQHKIEICDEVERAFVHVSGHIL